jgi:acyl-CoA thioesterase
MADAAAQDIAERSARAMWADDHAAQALGMTLLSVGPGRAELAMTVGPAMVNGHGLCHGGYIFTLADTAFAYACNSYGQRNVAQSAQIAFIAPGRRDMRLVAVAMERQRGDRSGLYDITVKDAATGTIIAEFRGASRSIPGSLLD